MFSLICGDDLLFSDHSYTAAFYVETENGCFPSPDWTDFPQTVLEWWSGELKSVNTGSDRYTYKFCFMDGPYTILCRKNDDRLTLSFLRNTAKTLPDCETSVPEMECAIRAAMETLKRRLYLAGRTEYIPPLDRIAVDLRDLTLYRQ